MSTESRRIRVLLADDHAVTREGLQVILERSEEFEVVGQARDGVEAVKAASELSPDLIVMDVMMPKKDGVEACREIMESLPETRVIMLTASTEANAVIEAVAAGATGYLEAAKSAGVGRIVHFSVTNVSSGSGLPYFRGKAQVEDMLKGLGVSHAIIRPTLTFGVGDLLLNNMAWALRRFPVFPVYGNGDYPVQPVYVEDLAAQAAEAGSLSESSVADAAGPDTFSFEALLRLLASSMDVRRWFLHTPPRVGLALTGLVGLLMRDMALTRDEVVGLMDGLLTSGEPPTGTTRLTDWLAENGDGLGRRYVSELRRNFRG